MGRRRILCPVLLQGAFAMFWNVWHLGANPLHSFPQLLVPKFSVFGLGDQRLTASATFWHHFFRFSSLIYLSIYLSICLSIYLSIHLQYLSIYPSIDLSIHLSIHPPIWFFWFAKIPPARYRKTPLWVFHPAVSRQERSWRRRRSRFPPATEKHLWKVKKAMDQYLYIPFLGGWKSIYQLFWCEQKKGIGFWSIPI